MNRRYYTTFSPFTKALVLILAVVLLFASYTVATEISHQNSMNAMFNAGIRLMAQTLIDQLTKDDETEE